MPTVKPIEREETLEPVRTRAIPTDVAGGGLEKTQRAVGKITSDLFEKERLKANKIVMSGNETTYQQFELTQSGEGGAFTQVGRNAVGVSQGTLAGFDKMNDELVNNAPNDETKVLTEEMGLRYRIKLQGRLNKHEFEQYDVVQGEAYVTSTETTSDYASSADENLTEGLINIEATTRDFLRGQGKSKEFIDDKVRDQQSATIIKAIKRKKAEGDSEGALELFNDKRSQKILDVEQKTNLRGVLETNNRLAQVETTTREIRNEEDDIGKQLEMADKKYKNKPEHLEETMKRLKTRHADDELVRKDRERQENEEVSQELKRLKEEGLPDGALQARIDQIEDSATRKNMQAIIFPKPITQNNNKAWVDFLSKTPQELSEMTAFEAETKYWSKFDAVHRTRAETMWQNSSKKEAKTTSIITPSAMAESTWRSLGLGKPSETPDAFADFEQEFQDQVTHFELTTLGGNRKASRDELNDILSTIALEHIMVDVDLSFFPTGTTRIPLGEVDIGAEIEGVEFERPKVSPKRQKAIDRLIKDGKPVTEANITFIEERL